MRSILSLNEFNMKNTVKDSWSALHPYHLTSTTDFHYIAMVEAILPLIKESFSLNKEECEWIGCSVVAYIEDKISNTQIFNTFSKSYYALNKVYIPFYKTSNRYSIKNINKLDIAYLLWTTYTQIGLTNASLHIICPNEQILLSLAENIYQSIRRYINLNYELKNISLWNYYFKNNQDNPVDIFQVIMGMAKYSYLFTTYDQFKTTRKCKNTNSKYASLDTYKSLILDKLPHEWYALILQNQNHPFSHEIMHMEIRTDNDYLFEFSDLNSQIFSHEHESERYYHISLSKYMDISKLKEHKHYLHTALLKYKGNWELYPPVSISKNKRECKQTADIQNEDGIIIIKASQTDSDCLKLSKQNYFKIYNSTHEIISNFANDPYKQQCISESLKSWPGDPLMLHWIAEENSYAIIPELSKFINTSLEQTNNLNQLTEFIRSSPRKVRIITYSLIAREFIKIKGYPLEMNMLSHKDLQANKDFIISFFKQII